MAAGLSMHLLLVEDDLNLGRALAKAMEAEGLACEWLRLAADARRFVLARRPDVILLDLTLPDGEGLNLLQGWRDAELDVPILVITARADLETRLEGLRLGADDVLLKPFATAELLARVHAITRRHARQSRDVWRLGVLEIEPRQRQVRVAGQDVDLSPREFAILLELAREAGQVVSKNALAERLEPLGDPLDLSTIEVHVSNLRRKIGAGLIVTLRGVGYRLAP